MNVPSVFQILMKHILLNIKPEDGPSFVMANIDILLVFSTLATRLDHLSLAHGKLMDVGLKHNARKCSFICKEVETVEYLGHIITLHGVKPNNKLIAAINPLRTKLILILHFFAYL